MGKQQSHALEDTTMHDSVSNDTAYDTFLQLHASQIRKYAEAIADFTQAIKLQPNYAEAYLNRGNAKYTQGRHEEAIEEQQRAVLCKAYGRLRKIIRFTDEPISLTLKSFFRNS